jgi:hypothetical protein
MQKGNLYEAIFTVNRGIDDAVNALERLKSDYLLTPVKANEPTERNEWLYADIKKGI